MKWFKHFSDAHDDEKLSEALCIHGAGAYGVFWLIVEAVAAQMDGTNKCLARYHYKKWATITHVDRRTLTRYLQTFNILTLIVSQECDNFVTIEIPKLLKLRDNYTKDLQATTRKTSKQEVEVEVEEEKTEDSLDIWVRKEIHKVIGRTMNSTEFGKLPIVTAYSRVQIETALQKTKDGGGNSLNYILKVLQDTPEVKPKKGRLRK